MQRDVFRGAGDTSGCNVLRAGGAVPVSGGGGGRAKAPQVVWAVAPVADEACVAIGGDVFIAAVAGGSF